jgi:hypothetical protein
MDPFNAPASGPKLKLVCLLKLDPVTILPPLIDPSSTFRMLFSVSPVPSTITTPLHFFQLFATSSSTFSASPSSRHPEPQCFPMKLANAESAEEVKVRLCFLVNVRKASGLSVAGGSSIGRTVARAAGLRMGGARMGAVLRGLMGWTGVPNAGEDEGMTFWGIDEGFAGLLEVAIL